MDSTSHITEITGSIVLLLMVAAGVLALSKRIRFPFPVLLVASGMLLSQLADFSPRLLAPITEFELSSELIFMVFLPTLIFESSFNLNARRLKYQLMPVLGLAVPGLLISTSVIGLIVWAVADIPLIAALLLGAILSATDPVAVIALFKQLGAPQRLTILVEGESLFNDATAIVLSRLLVVALVSGALLTDTIMLGIGQFFLVFFGGLLLGVVLALIAGKLLGSLESEPLIEVSITTALAYLSYLLAEEVFGLSGVMATVGAGITMGAWGRLKISPSVQVFMARFWQQLAFMANSMIFLLLGLTINLQVLWNQIDLILWVILAMTVARAMVVYGLIPAINRLPGTIDIESNFQTVMFWGGLRGAIALALVMSLPETPYTELFQAVVSGAVLFSLLVQGATIEPLMKWLGLNKQPLADSMALLERDLDAQEIAIGNIPALTANGMFSAPISYEFKKRCYQAKSEVTSSIEALRESELDREHELNILYLRAFAEERVVYTNMYNDGHLTEGAYRELLLVLSMQVDAIRYTEKFEHVHSHRLHRWFESHIYDLFDRFGPLRKYADRLRMQRIMRNYEEVWGHYHASQSVLYFLTTLSDLERIPRDVLDEVREKYLRWHNLSAEQLSRVTEQFPEFVASAQKKLGERLLLLAEAEATENLALRGVLPNEITEEQLARIRRHINRLRGEPAPGIGLHPIQLLQKVPLFKGLSIQEIHKIADLLRLRTFTSGEVIVRQGKSEASMFFIIKGIVRIFHEEDGKTTELGNLIAGNFFGEMVLMGHESLYATIQTITPCMIYELTRDDMDQLVIEYPSIQENLLRADEVLSKEWQSIRLTASEKA